MYNHPDLDIPLLAIPAVVVVGAVMGPINFPVKATVGIMSTYSENVAKWNVKNHEKFVDKLRPVQTTDSKP